MFLISKRCSNASNKFLTSCDPKKPTKNITYFDKNNLYFYAMSKSLPNGEFKQLNPVKYNLDKYDDGV